MKPEIARKKAHVISNSVETRGDGNTSEVVAEVEGAPFLLCVAQHRRNKNALLALRVFNLLLREGRLQKRTRLLIIGRRGPETPAVEAFVANSGLRDSVVLLYGISDSKLQWSYGNCSLLIAPSIVEGFGLPVAEGLLAGCRVVCSDIPAFREIDTRRISTMVSLGSQEEERFAEAICRSLFESAPLPIDLPELSPTVMAERYVRLYRSLLPAQAVTEQTDLVPIGAARGGQYQL